MKSKSKKSANGFTIFLVACIIFSAIGCKKELAVTETTQGAANTSALAKSAPITFTTNTIIDVSIDVFIPCANGGAGETAVLTGPLHILTTFTIGGNFISGKDHFQPQGISGTGDVTGNKYQATGLTEDNFKGSLINGQFSYTYVNNFRIIGQGPGNNFLVHSVFHQTINANGELTSYVDHFSVECK